MNDSLLEKMLAIFCSASVGNMYTTFRVDCSSHFGTGGHEVFIYNPETFP